MAAHDAASSEGSFTIGRDRRRASIVLGLALLLTVALVPRLYLIRGPFLNQADHLTAAHSGFARNFLERGFIATRLGLVANSGYSDPETVQFFSHHPPTISVLTALSFAVFGAEEWAARLIPALLSAATCPLIFLIGRRLLGGVWAGLAAGLFAFAPGAILWGQTLDHEPFIVFAGLSCILAWCKHVETGRQAWLTLALAFMACAIFTDWPGNYLVPALLAGSALTPSLRPRLVRIARQIVLTGAAALLVVGGHILFLKGSFEDLGGALVLRVFSNPELGFTWSEYAESLSRTLRTSLTVPGTWMSWAGLGLAVLAGFVHLIRRARDSRPGAATRVPIPALAVAVVVFGITHHVVFRNATHYNPQLAYLLFPGMVLAAAAGPCVIQEILRIRLASLPATAMALAVSLLPVGAVARDAGPLTWWNFHAISYPGWALAGMALHNVIPEGETLMATVPLYQPQFYYYLWRPRNIEPRDPQELVSAPAGTFILRDRNTTLSPEMEPVFAEHPAADLLNLSLYEKGSTQVSGFDTLASAEVSLEMRDIRFGEEASLVAYGFGPQSVAAANGSLLERYLGLEWNPSNIGGRIVHGTFLWERLGGSAGKVEPWYELFLVASRRTWRVTPMWRLDREAGNLAHLEPGAIVRHEMDWFMGEWLTEGEYTLRVGVVVDGRVMPPVDVTGLAGKTSVDLGTIRLGGESESKMPLVPANQSSR